jgi:two-component system, cell cycle response regulator DivK
MNDPAKKTVLIVEDNDKNMKLARDILEAKGYTVLCATSGEQGVVMARTAIPDLVLMDIQMPGIDGIEAFQQLRAEPSTAAIPVAAYTASVTAGDRSRVTEAGFDAFVSKPLNLKEFLATIARLTTDTPA